MMLKGVFTDFNNPEFYHGHCLYLEHENFMMKAIGKSGSVEDFVLCPKCKIKWSIGWGIFSPSPDCSVKKNTEYLKDFEDLTV